MQSITPLSNEATVAFSRKFHVESFRGGMNRLLLRAYPTKDEPTRVEVLFQYVQYLQLPTMKFDGLEIVDVTAKVRDVPRFREILLAFPNCRVFQLESQGKAAGELIAAGCSYGEDMAANGSPSMFPMMD